jgi:LPS export ABC transporter protein LptC
MVDNIQYILNNLIYFTIIIFLGLACSNDDDLKSFKEYTGPVLEVDSSLTLYSDSAKVRVKVLAAKQFEFNNGDQEFPEGIYIEFFETDGILSSTLKADKGYYTKETDLYTAVGNVILVSLAKNEQLNTEELFWKRNEQRVYTDKFVRIESNDEILTGEGLTAKQDFSSYKILKPAGTFSIEADQ